MNFFFKQTGLKPYPIEEKEWFLGLDEVLPLKNTFKRLKNGELESSTEPIKCAYRVLEEEVRNIPHLTERFEECLDETLEQLICHMAIHLLVFYYWDMVKQICRFDNTLFENLTKDTMPCDISTRVISEKLPFDSFFIDNPITDKNGDVYRGVYVTRFTSRNRQSLLLFFMKNVPKRDFRYIYIPLDLGEKTLEEVAEINSIPIEEYYGVPGNDRNDCFYLAKKALNLIAYLCSEDIDIERITLKVQNGKKKHIKVKKALVGKEYGRKICDTKQLQP